MSKSFALVLSFKYKTYLFCSLTLLVFLGSFAITKTAEFALHPSIFAPVLTLDLVVVIPALYLLLIRHSRIPNISVVPILIICIYMAMTILPSDYQNYLNLFKLLVIPMEVILLWFIGLKAYRFVSTNKNELFYKRDYVENLYTLLYQKSKNRLIAGILTTEISIFYYACFGWRVKPNCSKTLGFPYYNKSGYIAIIMLMLPLIILETAVIHLLIQQWSHTIAWVFTGLSMYGVIFLIGDLNAVRDRPIYLDNNILHFRVGMRWWSKLLLNEIIDVKKIKRAPQQENHMNLVLWGSPNIQIDFCQEQKATGFYGYAKTFRSLSFFVDDPEVFVASIRSKMSAIR